MSMRPTLWLVTLALLNAGCTLVSDGVHVVGYRTRRALDDSREWHRDSRLAAAAWAEAGDQAPGRSADYADGFKEGFAAHLFRGTCEPPPLAPARYRSARTQTAAGYQAAEDWLNGFRHGVTEAQHRGLRDLVTGPSAFRTVAPPEAAPVLSTLTTSSPSSPEAVPMPSAPTTPALPAPAPSSPPIVASAAVIPVAVTPAAVTPAAARVVSLSPSENLPPHRPLEPAAVDEKPMTGGTALPNPLSPRRPTMQQVVRNRLAIVPVVGWKGPVDPAPPPQPTDERAPRWTSNRPPAPDVVWRRSDESSTGWLAGTRGPRADGIE